MRAEGWYQDPYTRHTDRWFSDGKPTALVRDAGVESHDPPPFTPYSGKLIESATTELEDGADLRRADDMDEGAALDSGKSAIDHEAETGSGFPVP
jgi:hypothetical protein